MGFPRVVVGLALAAALTTLIVLPATAASTVRESNELGSARRAPSVSSSLVCRGGSPERDRSRARTSRTWWRLHRRPEQILHFATLIVIIATSISCRSAQALGL